MRISPAVAYLICFLSATCLSAGDPAVFPKPRHVDIHPERLPLAETLPLLLPSQPSGNDLFLAHFLIAELSERYGVALHTKTVSSLPPNGSFILLGSSANPLVREYLTHHEPPPAESEGYALEVNDRAAVVAGAGESGAFYGLQSLRQLIERVQGGVNIHGATIRDWPSCPSVE